MTNGRDIDVQRLGDPLLRNPAVNRFQDHLVLLNRRQPVDPFVVGEGLVFSRDKAVHSLGAALFQNLDPEMTIEQQKLALFVTISNDDGWLYDPNFTD